MRGSGYGHIPCPIAVESHDDILRLQPHPRTLSDKAGDEVLQLSDIPRPVILLEDGERRDGHPQYLPLISLVVLVEKVLEEQGNILAALPQRRYSDGHDMQAIEEILTKEARIHPLHEIVVRRRNNTHIGVEGLHTSHALEGVLLQNPQESGLPHEGQTAYLIKA